MNEEKETRNLNEERPEEAGSEPRAGGEVRDPEEVTVQAGIEQTEDSDGKPEPAESADSQELAEQELNPAEPDLPELPGSPDQETAGQQKETLLKQTESSMEADRKVDQDPSAAPDVPASENTA